MRKLDTILWTLFTLTGVILSVFLIRGDKVGVMYSAIIYVILCLALQYLNLKNEREKDLKYIRR